jgi:hypothetical protein
MERAAKGEADAWRRPRRTLAVETHARDDEGSRRALVPDDAANLMVPGGRRTPAGTTRRRPDASPPAEYRHPGRYTSWLPAAAGMAAIAVR